MGTGMSSPAVQLDPPKPWAPWRLAQVVVGDVADLSRYRYVLYNFVSHDLKLRYHRSVLGFLWTLLHPILMMAVLTIFFSNFMGRNIDGYALYLFSGMLPWIFFSTTVANSAACLIQSQSLIRKIYLPKLLFPTSRMLINLVNLLLSMAALFVLFQFLSAKVTWALVMLPLGIVFLAVFTQGLAMLAATVNTFYRDFGHILTILLQAWYFATPILYQPNILNPRLQRIVAWNPVHVILKIFQNAIYFHEFSSASDLQRAGLCALCSLLIGYVAFKVNEDRFIFRL